MGAYPLNKDTMDTMDTLIRKMIEKEGDISFILDDAPDVVIAPAILDEGSTTIKKNIGKVEYQVSDGPVGQRGESWDCYSWKEARKLAMEMQKALKEEA